MLNGYCLFPIRHLHPFPIPLEFSLFTFTYACTLILYPFIHRWLPLQCRLRQFWNGITRQNRLTTTYRSLKLFRLSLKMTFDLPKIGLRIWAMRRKHLVNVVYANTRKSNNITNLHNYHRREKTSLVDNSRSP